MLFQEDQSFQTVERPQKRSPSIQIIFLNLLCKKAGPMLKTVGIFLKKNRNIGKIPEGAILITADVVGLYPSIPHGARFRSTQKKT